MKMFSPVNRMGIVEREDLLPPNIVTLDLLRFYFGLLGRDEESVFEMISILGIQGSLDQLMRGEEMTNDRLLLKKLNLAIEILNEPYILFL